MALDRIADTGPWTAIDMWEPDCSFIGGPGYEVEGDDSRCACCGARITWRVIVQAGSGKNYYMGRTCAAHAGNISGLDKAESIMKARVMAFITGGDEQHRDFREWLKSQPHPKKWAGRSLFDEVKYQTGYGKDITPVLKALREFLAVREEWLKTATTKHERKNEAQALVDADPAMKEWLLSQKHPKGWRGKRRYDDVRYWAVERDERKPFEDAKVEFAALPEKERAKWTKKAAKATQVAPQA